jgi:hypothetical protein
VGLAGPSKSGVLPESEGGYFDAAVDKSVEVDIKVIEDGYFFAFILDVVEDQRVPLPQPSVNLSLPCIKTWDAH